MVVSRKALNAFCRPNMIGRVKIKFAVAFILLGALVIVFWPEEDDSEATILFAGVSARDTNHVTFTLTNRFNRTLHYQYDVRVAQAQSLTPENWLRVSTNNSQTSITIGSHTAAQCHAIVPSTNRWRIALTRKTKGKSFAELGRTRQKLWNVAEDMGGTRFSQWVWSGETFQTLFGPEMLGNKLLPQQQE
jgi:hypothetical protein